MPLLTWFASLDPEVSTLSSINNVQNSLFVAILGQVRQPAANLHSGPEILPARGCHGKNGVETQSLASQARQTGKARKD